MKNKIIEGAKLKHARLIAILQLFVAFFSAVALGALTKAAVIFQNELILLISMLGIAISLLIVNSYLKGVESALGW